MIGIKIKTVLNAVFISLMVFFASVNPAISANQQQDQERPRVVSIYVASGPEEAEWFEGLYRNSSAAAEALNIDLEQIFAGTDRPVVLKKLEERLQQPLKPDYVIFANQRGLGMEMLKLCDKYGVDSFLYVAPLLPEEHKALGGPRGTLKHWIGELIPDDERAGYDLTKALIKDVKSRKESQADPIRMLGITGIRSTTSASQREKGLHRALAENNEIELLQVVAARWFSHIAKQKYELLIGRYGAVDAVWVANDPMALGVAEAIGNDDTPPSVGGVDWVASAVEATKDGRLIVSMGGHFIDIAYVLALLRNHYDGEDFAEIVQSPSLESYLVPLTAENVDEYDIFLEKLKRGEIDFRAALSGLTSPEALSNLTMARFIERSKINIQETP